MKPFASVLTLVIAGGPLALLLYAGWWAMQYRMPPSAAALIDLRRDTSEEPRYITFCAALANNNLGFPGHAYVVWSSNTDFRSADAETVGFVPRYRRDQIPSLVADVPGLMVSGADAQNSANLDALTVIVDNDEFERSKKLRDRWDPSVFHTGVRDCVAFVDYIASDVGLNTPPGKFCYPQDHIKLLKRLNRLKPAHAIAQKPDRYTVNVN